MKILKKNIFLVCGLLFVSNANALLFENYDLANYQVANNVINVQDDSIVEYYAPYKEVDDECTNIYTSSNNPNIKMNNSTIINTTSPCMSKQTHTYCSGAICNVEKKDLIR